MSPAHPARGDSSRELSHLESVFSALAHPSRRHILLVLHYRGGELTAGEIAAGLPCSWPTTSRHLQILAGAELVTSERHGRERVYRLEHQRLDVVRDWIGWFDRA